MSRPLRHSPSPPDLSGGESPGRALSPQPHPARGSSFESAASSPADTEPRTATFLPVVRGDYSVRFSHPGEHEAMHAAEAWCKARGFSVGAMQADAPRGIMLGEMSIAKWRNLDGYEKADLHGRMEAPGRTWRKGPVTITIRSDVHSDVKEAFWSEPEADPPAAPAVRAESSPPPVPPRLRHLDPTDMAAMIAIEGRSP